MTNEQASRTSQSERELWTTNSLKRRSGEVSDHWYAANTREPIRDETLRGGLIPTGAVVERSGLAATSPLPRYALNDDFARLFDPRLEADALEEDVGLWQDRHLSQGALARVHLLRKEVVAVNEGVLITFPNGETRRMAPGPSSVISKAVIEEFAPRFLDNPGVIFLSESRKRIVARDDALARQIGIRIEADRHLPDIILVDLGPIDPFLVFVEVVATSGAIDERRQAALLAYATDAGFNQAQIAFVTAFRQRDESPFMRSVAELAWNSFAWFKAEPDHVIIFRSGDRTSALHLHHLLGNGQ